MASEEIEQSLRAELDDYINGRLNSLRDEITRLQSQFNEAFTRLSERVGSEMSADNSVAVSIAEHMRAARNSGIEAAATESTRAKASSDLAILKAAVDEIDQQRSQADILNALVNRAAAFAPRIAFFVIKNDRVTGWRARGLEGTVGDDAVREISLPLSSDTLLGEVARTHRTWSGAPGTHADDHQIFGRFSDGPPQRIIAIPLVARDKAVAVLYADCAEMDGEAISLEALETLVRVSGMAVELLAAKRSTPPETREAHSTPTRPTSATPPTHAFEPVAGEQPAAPAHHEPAATAFESAPAEIPAHPAHADESVVGEQFAPATFEEPVPAYEPQPEIAPEVSPEAEPPDTMGMSGGTTRGLDAAPESPPTASPLGTARRYGADADLPIEVADAEKRFHNDARRFARLLVSEIKLYNEQKVREGRDAGDLYDRLREDIDRSRQMYDKRVAHEVSQRYDYFHHELVNTLAEGDSQKLGGNYPNTTQ